MNKKTALIFFLLTIPIVSQNGVYDFHSYSLKIEGNSIRTFSNDNKLLFEKKFFHPEDYLTDLDSDGVNELVVIDYLEKENRKYYSVFFYNTIDTFYLADSIFSGYVKPYGIYSEDVDGIVYVSADTRFDIFNSDSSVLILPINCWKFEDGAVYLANASVYDVFLGENDLILQTLDDYYASDGKTCGITRKIQSVIASGYINYCNAGEQTVANQFLKKYYLCDDIEVFKTGIMKIFNNQK